LGSRISSGLIGLVEYGASLGVGFTEVFAERRTESSISYEQGRIERLWSGAEIGTGIRLIRDGSVVYVTANSFDVETLKRSMREAVGVFRGLPEGTVVRVGGRPSIRPGAGFGTESTTVNERLASAVVTLNESAYGYSPAVAQVKVNATTSQRTIFVANSLGVAATDDQHMTSFRAAVVCKRGHKRELGTYSPARANRLDRFLVAHPPEEIGRMAAHLSATQLDAVPAPTGSMPVIVGNEKGGALVHEACVHPLEADFVSRDNSVYRGRLGERIASPVVTVLDDPIGAGDFPGAYSFDDEGTPGRASVLVENGRLCSYLTDSVSASKLGHVLTGNGRRQSYEYLPMPRMSNTFIAPGGLAPEEIIGATRRGVYARQVSGGEVNQITGEFVFRISEGYLIENGRISTPIRPTTLVGRGPDVLQQIDLVGNDLQLAAAQCGKGGQVLMVGVGQPTIRIKEMVVGGTRT